MNYLVQLKLANRPANPQEGIVFIEQMKMCGSPARWWPRSPGCRR
jgi:hypothetical protein